MAGERQDKKRSEVEGWSGLGWVGLGGVVVWLGGWVGLHISRRRALRYWKDMRGNEEERTQSGCSDG